MGQSRELLAPVEDDVLARIEAIEPRPKLLVLDRQQVDGVSEAGERGPEGRDIRAGFARFRLGPIGVQVVEEDDGKIVTAGFNHDPPLG
jgi:hypothetical protein